jgi:6-phosphogluconolactonase (cycloisomerase 2 family)
MLVCAGASLCAATSLFVSSYAGNITTLSLTERGGKYDLQKTFYNDGCLPNPSWLTLDADRGLLCCLDEGLTVANGSLSSYKINNDGSLHQVEKKLVISGPVNGLIYGSASGNRSIALAQYTGSALSTFALGQKGAGTFTPEQTFPFTLRKPGPNPARQDAPHPHEAISDPTGQYILVPDLGADLVRIFSFAEGTNRLTTHTPLSVTPGSGPRHAAFYNPYGIACANCTSYLFVVTELGNTVTSYAVTYPAKGGLSFKQVYRSSTYGPLPLPEGNAAAEIALSVNTTSHRCQTLCVSIELMNPPAR